MSKSNSIPDAARFKRSLKGLRLYRERRGLWHVQNPARPDETLFCGTIREIEKALKLTKA